MLNFFKKCHHKILRCSPCLICRNTTSIPFYLCRTCLTMLPTLSNFCPKCFSLKHFSINNQCQKTFHRAYALYGYEGYIKEWLLQLKFHKQIFFAHLLGNLLGHALHKNLTLPLPQIMLPVPLHPKRLQERGFNQSYQIAKTLKKILKIPVDNNLLHKTKHTPPQSSLSIPAKYRNLKNSFEANYNHYQHVAIIDDIYTTGTTAKTIAKQLRKTGINKIEIWCIARSFHVT